MRAALLAICCSAARAQRCVDAHDDCADWSAAGECRKNAGWMKTNCRRSCGGCTMQEVAEDLLGDGAYSISVGQLVNPTGKSAKKRYHILKAATQCNRTKTCLGFSIPVSLTNADSPFPLRIVEVTFGFKTSSASVNETLGWATFLKGELLQCASPTCNSTSWSEKQGANFHVRSAELCMEKGVAGAKIAIKQAKAALSAGADPEVMHMLRANAHLMIDKIEDSKKEVELLLNINPNHEEGQDLKRSLVNYKTAVSDAVDLERTKRWSDALLRYEDAQASLPSSVMTSTVRDGLCRMHLKVRNYTAAVSWCANSHGANPSNIDLLFKHVDARWAHGEEHFALQLLKIALVDFPRNDRFHEVQERALELERLLKDRSKVDYYQELGVSRTASAQDIKKAYRKLAKIWHPDRKKGDDDQHDDMFKKVSRAHEILSDQELRRRYDAGEDVEAILFQRGQQ